LQSRAAFAEFQHRLAPKIVSIARAIHDK